MLYTSDIEVCIRVTLKGVDELRAHRAHHILLTQRIILRALSACYFALSARLEMIQVPSFRHFFNITVAHDEFGNTRVLTFSLFIDLLLQY